ncbi:MAG: hypothetical protein ACOYMN_16850 [Roseimicrobium sp.]
MKFLFNVILVAAAAKYLMHTPDHTSPRFEGVNEVTMRDISRHVDTVFARLEETLRFILS